MLYKCIVKVNKTNIKDEMTTDNFYVGIVYGNDYQQIMQKLKNYFENEISGWIVNDVKIDGSPIPENNTDKNVIMDYGVHFFLN